uniref:Triple QxxK/R motif-containing protein n=1 Tax=Equus caballus TaxID=9796 RepID=A0A9L0SET6_HORSE
MPGCNTRRRMNEKWKKEKQYMRKKKHKQAFWRSKMGRKDASTIKLPVDQYRKQIGKQDYKKTKPILRATKLKAEARKTAIGIKLALYLQQYWPSYWLSMLAFISDCQQMLTLIWNQTKIS